MLHRWQAFTWIYYDPVHRHLNVPPYSNLLKSLCFSLCSNNEGLHMMLLSIEASNYLLIKVKFSSGIMSVTFCFHNALSHVGSVHPILRSCPHAMWQQIPDRSFLTNRPLEDMALFWIYNFMYILMINIFNMNLWNCPHVDAIGPRGS